MERTFEIEELLNEAGWLRRLAASLVGDRAQAEDLVQDTWVAALRRPPSAGGAPRPWLGRVVRNLARNAGRDRARREAREDFAQEERPDPGPAALVQEAEAQRLLAEAVTRLAEPLRAVIVLRYFQGLDSSAAAARLGLPASTVRTRLQKALEELRADLDGRFEGGRRSWGAFLAPLVHHSLAGVKGASAGAVVSVGALGSWPILITVASAALVLATIGASHWNATRSNTGPVGAPLAAQVASVTHATSQESVAPSAGQRQAVETRAESEPIESEASLVGTGGSLQGSTRAAEKDTAELSGTILVDGRPPEWPIRLALEPMIRPVPAEKGLMRKRVRPLELTLPPEQRGAFRFGELSPAWSGRLSVSDYTFADGSSALEIDAPVSGLVVQLNSGPEIVGGIRTAGGLPIPGLEGGYNLRIVDEGIVSPRGGWDHEETGRFSCRTDGRFRIASPSLGARGSLWILVEDPDHGYLRHETPDFVPSAGYDLGELELEALRALEFTVRDPQGTPIEGAFARVDGPSWRKRAPLTGADGSGVLKLVPDRAVDVRFSAFAHADRVLPALPGSRLDVVLEPLAVLEIHLLGSLGARADRVLLSAERPAFLWDESGWGESAQFQLQLGRVKSPYQRRVPSTPDQRFEYEFAPTPDGRVELVGLTPDLLLTLELLDAEGRSLDADTISVTRGQRAALDLGEADSAGDPPITEKRQLRTRSSSKAF